MVKLAPLVVILKLLPGLRQLADSGRALVVVAVRRSPVLQTPPAEVVAALQTLHAEDRRSLVYLEFT